MARYGDSFYGLAYYGAATLVDFDASPFLAIPTDYGKITVTWTEPTGSWDKLRLLRNPFGFPMTPDDGDLLVSTTQSEDEVLYVDTGQVPNNSGLLEGHTYYYSIFVRETTQYTWVKAGEALGVSVRDYGTVDQMYEYLPAVYKVNNVFSATDNDTEINDDLYNFLNILAFEHDFFKTMAQNVSERYDTLNLDGRMIPTVLNQFGLGYEPTIGLQQARILLRNAIRIFSNKGNLFGLKTYVTAFSGFNCEIGEPINLMLDVNSGSFKESLGFWESETNVTLTRGTATSETPAITPYIEPLSPSNYPNSSLGFMKATATSSGEMVFACGVSDPKLKGIPVRPGETYTLSLYSWAKTTARTVTVDIHWYDRFATFLGSTGEVSYTNNTSDWSRSPGSTGSAPANAFFAVPQVRISGAASGEVHYIDAVQFEKSASVTTFIDPRRIDIILKANRVNLVKNPSFEAGGSLSYWEESNGADMYSPFTVGNADDSPIADEFDPIKNGLFIWDKASNTVAINVRTSEDIEVTPGAQYALSGYIKGAFADTVSTDSVTAKITWFDEANILISTTSGTSVSILAQEWVRASVVGTAPSNAKYARVNFEFPPTGRLAIFQLDGVLFERSSYVAPYFDGSYGYNQLSDLVWEGTPGYSRSHYYKNRLLVQDRLAETVGSYILHGVPWAIFVAQPD